MHIIRIALGILLLIYCAIFIPAGLVLMFEWFRDNF